MEQQSILRDMHYRALEGTNTKTRRLAYLTALVSMLGRGSLGERALLAKIARWGQDHRANLEAYWVQSGEVTSTRLNSAGGRYLHLAANLGLVAPISGTYRASRVGLVLFTLLQKDGFGINPYFLTQYECLFYLYLLLEQDADILLTITDYLMEHAGMSLARIQADFQGAFIARLSRKLSLSQDEMLRQRLLERRGEVERWIKPQRYAEHIVPPRLHWLLDLDFLKPRQFKRHRYTFTEPGTRFLFQLPRLGDSQFRDVGDKWLASDFWTVAIWEQFDIKASTCWGELDDETRREICAPLLQETFKAFQHTVVSKVSLSQALLYLSIRLVLEHKIAVGPAALTEWLSVPQVLDGRRYEMRFSPRENESYLVLVSRNLGT